MNEDSLSGWAGLTGSSPYSADNASLSQAQNMGNATSGMSAMSPPVGSLLGGYGGAVSPSSVNGYPMFSSPQAGLSSPSGYANANPIDATPSVIQSQARGLTPSQMPMNPSMPTAATSNPWNIKQSSTSSSFDYPMGQNVPPPKLNVL